MLNHMGWICGRSLTSEQKKKPSSTRAADQKSIDKALLSTIKKEELLASYLGTSFSLRKGDKPHLMQW
jgi:large subunit ribosomal protein L6e